MSQPDLPNQVPVCPRHTGREAYVRCQRCGRPTCFECQRPAAVGVQCPDCVEEHQKTARQGTTRYGATVTSRSKPYATYTIIAICVAVFIGQLANEQVTREMFFAPILADVEPWRYLTAAFVHSPSFYAHIAFNMFAVWICGNFLEPLLGRVRFVLLYLISAVGGSVAYLMIAPRIDEAAWFAPTVGASGAVFGLFAASFVFSRHLGRESGGIVAILVINGVLGFVVPNIAWEAHLGGLLTGAALAAIIAVTHPRERTRRERLQHWQWLGFAAVALILVALALVGAPPLPR